MIFILPLIRSYFIAVLPVDQKINLGSPYATVWTYFLLLELFCSIYTEYKNVFSFFIGRRGEGEVLKLQYFKLLYQRHIQKFLKRLRWSFLLKAVNSLKKIILDIWVLTKLLTVMLESYFKDLLVVKQLIYCKKNIFSLIRIKLMNLFFSLARWVSAYNLN